MVLWYVSLQLMKVTYKDKLPDVTLGTLLASILTLVSVTDSQPDSGGEGRVRGATFTPVAARRWCFL